MWNVCKTLEKLHAECGAWTELRNSLILPESSHEHMKQEPFTHFHSSLIWTFDCSKQLEEDQYGKAEELHRNKMIEMRTTQLLSKDLKLYEEALDQ